jgi:hypothetical protein
MCSYGRIEVQFQHMKPRARSTASRSALVRRVNEVLGVAFTSDVIGRGPARSS